MKTLRTIDRIRAALGVPGLILGLLGALVILVIEWLVDLADVWDEFVGMLFRPVCRRHGHNLNVPMFGWRTCKRCDHVERYEKAEWRNVAAPAGEA